MIVVELELRARSELVEIRGKLQDLRCITWYHVLISIFFGLLQIGVIAYFSGGVITVVVSFMFVALQLYLAIKAWCHLVWIWETLIKIEEMIALDRLGRLP